MKAWIMIVGVVAIFAIAGFAVVKATSTTGEIVQTESETETTASCSSCPVGGCTAESNCGRSTCGATTGGSCGCGR